MTGNELWSIDQQRAKIHDRACVDQPRDAGDCLTRQRTGPVDLVVVRVRIAELVEDADHRRMEIAGKSRRRIVDAKRERVRKPRHAVHGGKHSIRCRNRDLRDDIEVARQVVRHRPPVVRRSRLTANTPSCSEDGERRDHHDERNRMMNRE
jgi:hypothetical protein